MVRGWWLIALTFAACGERLVPAEASMGSGSSGAATDGVDEASTSTGAEPCVFREIAVEGEHRPACDGLSEAECTQALTCMSVHARRVQTCDDTVTCTGATVYLGCAGLAVCKQEADFFCAGEDVFVAERRCIPPWGYVLCAPDVSGEAAEVLVQDGLACL